MKIKVCGMREPANIAALIELPIDFMGMIFYNKSKRYITRLPQMEIPENTQKVGVFVNEKVEIVFKKFVDFQLDIIQLHGSELPSYCQELREKSIRIIKAFSVDDDFDFSATIPYESVCSYFLFDTKGIHPGGNGEVFNWNILENYHGKIPFLLAGGITSRMAKSIKRFQHHMFYGIDLNSGFEISPGLKDIQQLKSFLYELRS